MWVSKYNLKNINPAKVQLPGQAVFDLPEKVLQFGTGVLLRGLPDYFIDKANKQGVFNGRVVVVKSTDGGDTAAFEKQDGLYTICVRGIENDVKQQENIVCAAISRVLSAKAEWNKVLECAHNPEMQIIISNTTEVGIELVQEDIRKYPPISFPGKLLAFLYERYKAFNGSKHAGMLIIPAELIVDNGKKLESIVTELAYLNGLEESFIDWLEISNTFCNSLVDRIVPGKPQGAQMTGIEEELGYKDDLVIMTEVYRLWAIEGDEQVAALLSFAQTDREAVVVVPDIGVYRELKLRLLNASHTLSSSIAFLSGFETVKDAMDDEFMCGFIQAVMQKEIARAIPAATNPAQTAAFAASCLDRFRNPFIAHQWLGITAQYTSKMKMRVIPVLKKYFEEYNAVPVHMAAGFAAYIYFMKAVKEEAGTYFGMRHDQLYVINDSGAAWFYGQWNANTLSSMAAVVLKEKSLWDCDLCSLPGFATAVQEKLNEIDEAGIAAAIDTLQSKRSIA